MKLPRLDEKEQLPSKEEVEQQIEAIENESIEKEETKWEVELSGTIEYKLFLSKTAYKYQCSHTPESQAIMIMQAIEGLEKAEDNFQIIAMHAKYDPNKALRKKAKESLPPMQNKMALKRALHELEKIKNSLLRMIMKDNLPEENKEEN